MFPVIEIQRCHYPNSHIFTPCCYSTCAQCVPCLKRKGLTLSASQGVQAPTRKKKTEENKTPPPKFSLDKQARGEEPLKETVYCSVSRKSCFFHILWFCNSSWKLKTFIFFRYNLCTWRLRKKDLKIPLLMKLLLLLDQLVHSPV